MFVLALVAVTIPATVTAEDVQQLLTRMRQALVPAKDMRADVDVETTNERGENVHWAGEYFRMGGAEGGIHMIFHSPLDLRGTEITARSGPDRQEHLRIYLPSLRRVRDIVGDMRGESFLGTDFNYEDLGLQQLGGWQSTRLDDETVDGRVCYRVESMPPSGWWYGRVVSSIAKKTYLPLRTEYYDRSGVLWKVRSFDKIESVSGHPTATRITMRTIPTNTSTSLTFTNVQYDTGLPARLFTSP